MRAPKHLSNPSYIRAGLGRHAEPSPSPLIDRTVISQHSVSLRLDGGLWVAEFDTVGYGISEKHNLLPSDAGRVLLARTMGHKCAILKSMGARFFASLEVYEGAVCLKAWAEKTQGEFGPLVQTAYEEE